MLILAIDTALDACSVALREAGAAGRIIAARTEVIGRGHAERLMAVIADVMTEAGTGFGDIERIGVTIGPGSFTGIRVGLATARGLALASGVPVVGVSTLDAIACAAPVNGPVLVVLDARRGEVYAGLYDRLCKPIAAPALLEMTQAADQAIAAGAMLFGSGADLVATARPGAGLVALGNAGYPDIVHVADLVARAPSDPHPPKPLYLRAPDAKPQTRGVVERAGGGA